MGLPPETSEFSSPRNGFFVDLGRRPATERAVHAILVEVRSELGQLSLQIQGIPEQDVVKALTTNRADQALHERMGYRRVRDGLDLLDVEDAKIRLPSVITKQRIVVGAQVVGCTFARDHAIEHAAQHDPISIAHVYSEADDPPSEQVHNDKDPVSLEGDGLASEEVHTPQAALHMPQEGQPRRPAGAGFRSVVLGKNASDHILVNFNVEGLGDNQSDSRAAEAWVSALQLDDGVNQLFRRALGTGLAASARRV